MNFESAGQPTKTSLTKSTKPLLENKPNKIFPIKPKQRRKSPILRKCEDLMEALWEDGFHMEIPWHILKDYVIALCGGFRTTITDYLGRREKYYKGWKKQGILKTPAKTGYLEKFGFIKRKSPKIIILHHERVDRPYHYDQSNIVSFSLSPFGENEKGIGALAPTNDTTLLLHTKREREIKSLKLTPEEKLILRASRGERDR